MLTCLKPVFRTVLFLFASGTLAVAGSPAQAITIHDNGGGGANSGTCNSGSGGCGTYYIFDDFTLAGPEVINGFTYDSFFTPGFSGPASYGSTIWKIWDKDPSFFFFDGAIASGLFVVGTETDLGGGFVRIAIGGLNIPLAAGTYWLQTHNVMDNGDSTYQLSTTGGGSPAQVSGFGAPIANDLPESAFTISAVPEPSSLLLLAIGTVGLSAVRSSRKRH